MVKSLRKPPTQTNEQHVEKSPTVVHFRSSSGEVHSEGVGVQEEYSLEAALRQTSGICETLLSIRVVRLHIVAFGVEHDGLFSGRSAQ